MPEDRVLRHFISIIDLCQLSLTQDTVSAWALRARVETVISTRCLAARRMGSPQRRGHVPVGKALAASAESLTAKGTNPGRAKMPESLLLALRGRDLRSRARSSAFRTSASRNLPMIGAIQFASSVRAPQKRLCP